MTRSVLLALFFLLPAVASANSSLSARSPSGERALAVPFQSGSAVVTEILIEGPDGSRRRIGLIVGGVEALAWSDDGESVLCREAPLRITLFGRAFAGHGLLSLKTADLWQLDRDGKDIRLLAEDHDLVSSPDTTFTPEPGRETTDALHGVSRGLLKVAGANNSMNRWDFKAAAYLMAGAVSDFRNLPKRHEKSGLFKRQCEAYAEALKHRADALRRTGHVLVCGEHVGLIGELIQGFEQEHGGRLPRDLTSLMEWQVERTENVGLDTYARALEYLLRLTTSKGPGRSINYFYWPRANEGEALLTGYAPPGHLVELIRLRDGFRSVSRPLAQAQIDSLIRVGNRHLDRDPDRAVAYFEMVAGGDPGYAPALSRLGHAYIQAGEPDIAQTLFERAILHDDSLPDVYYGLGLIHQDIDLWRYKAIEYYMLALRHDKNHVDARYRLAWLRYRLGELDGRKVFQEVLDLDPRHARAHLDLGKWHADFHKDREGAIYHFAQYLALQPDDRKIRSRLRRYFIRTKDSNRILERFPTLSRASKDPRALPVLASAAQQLGFCDRAQDYFEGYLGTLDQSERAYYDDIHLLASDEEMEGFSQVAETPAETGFVDRFWKLRDPDLTTAVNERRLEHYRRVWFARHRFAHAADPWDRRGEVYVRFGQPDHRSISGEAWSDGGLEVQNTRKRWTQALDVPVPPSAASSETDIGGPVYPVRVLDFGIHEPLRKSDELASAGNGSANLTLEVQGKRWPVSYASLGLEGALPAVAWESWVYTDVWDGIEITFTDEEGNGSCDFAPVPAGEGLPAALRSVLTQWSPSSIARSAAEERPICDPLEDLEDPLGFFHSLAAFKALEGGSTALEVYVSVPMNMGRHVRKERRTHLEVGESLALLDEETGAVHRQQSHLSYSGAGNLTQNTADRATDVLRLELRPGSYTLDLKVEDPALKRVSRIRKRIELPDYGAPGLACSDLNLGRLSQGSDQDPGFRKGGVDIIPDPTMVFNASESIVAYFEVYNLARNTVGQTHYRVAMSVTPQDSPGETSAIAGLTRYHGGDGRPSDTTFETRGPDAYGRECSELRITAGVTGPQILSIAITDLNNGHTVTKTASFTLVD